MNKRKLLTRIAVIASIVVLLGYITYLIFVLTDPNRFRSVIDDSVKSYIDSIDIPVPKDGKDASVDQVRSAVNEYLAVNPPQNGTNGQNATDEQVRRAVDTYMLAHPPKDGKDGQDGTNGADGKTPEIRCNASKNRWEVRFGVGETWQLLNGEKIRCTTGE